ncbi:50S ribosomal protein L23 [Aerosakkonemataceae cyanobacterium BLCC-F50]|uniref:Large ribosomal subunit protein uL23 n=1 Tax=Floridaenema flaviceps BLCC-F50 TaxID=3153642 RepID=A0ABV4Y431_9CYAN
MSEYDPRYLADIVYRPIVTEKATILMEQNKYTFEVVPKATKPEIKAAIENLFDVKVVSVNTILPPRKQRRVGKFVGFKARYKKAIVTIAPDDVEKVRQTLFPEV